MDKQLIAEAGTRAERILIANSSALGSLGSSKAYQQVWARASMIAGLGLWLRRTGDGRAGRRVDDVGDVPGLEPDRLEPAPATLAEPARHFIQGACHLTVRLLFVLDLDKVLNLSFAP